MARPSPRSKLASSPSVSKKRASPLPESTPRRQSKRVKAEQTAAATLERSTPKKSQYFEHESEPASDTLSESTTSAFDDASSPGSGPSDSSTVEDVSEDDFTPRGKATQKRKGVKIQKTKGAELWRTGVSGGLGLGKQVVVKLPKARSAGSTPYRDETIHPNTLLFLKDLASNNDRDWLKVHDADFRTSEKDFDAFVGCLTQKLIEKDDTIPELPIKDIKFRIYRDIRFSPDPTPYKPYFSGAWSRTGRKGPYAGYYVQVQPGNSFVGGGLWHPDSQPLALLRQNVDQRSHELKQVLTDPALRKEFLKGVNKDEKKVVDAFVDHNRDNILKTRPKGFSSDNPNIELLRLRNYVIGKKLEDREVVGPGALDRIADLLGVMTPFITHLNRVVMPDDQSSDDEESESGSDDDLNVDLDEDEDEDEGS